MTPAIITRANCLLTAPTDWDVATHGECCSLAVRKDGDTIQSAWIPDADELAALNAGGVVILTLYGAIPPVSLHVE
jgi:hypothetical protein